MHAPQPLDVDSFASCLAEAVGVPAAEVPRPGRDALGVWRAWLAPRGLGLVPVDDDPRTFGMPGFWIGVMADGSAALMFGSPSGRVDGGDGEPVAAFAFVALDPGPAASRPSSERGPGRVEAIVVAPAAEADVRLLDATLAVPGRGLEGDRYFLGTGTFSGGAGGGRDLTLVEAEVLDDLGLRPADARRNVVTRGIDLNALVGRPFAIGEVRCLGRRLCEPCAHLERLSGPGILRPLVHRGGLRADVLAEGTIRLGDAVSRAEP